MRYDAAILGAGLNGLAAAARLARAGLKTIVIERAASVGGRCTSREFHPGFRASPFADELAPIPVGIYWSLDLARRGAIFAPAARDVVVRGEGLVEAAVPVDLPACAQAHVGREINRWDSEADRVPPRRHWFRLVRQARTGPADAWSRRSLAEAVSNLAADEAIALTSRALAGRAVDPFLRGTALHLLTPGLGSSGMVAGGLRTLGEAFAAAARESGAEISCGLEATGIQHLKGRVSAVTLSDGTQVEAAAVLSTLDLKRTILSLFAWSDLPQAVVKRAADYRMSGSTARFLVALDAVPEIKGGDAYLRGAVIHATRTPQDHAAAYSAWRGGMIPEQPPACIRIVSAADPGLAPLGKATVTVTLGCIPYRLFDGGWTEDRRAALRARTMALIESVLPGSRACLVGCDLLVPSDIEDALGATDGDLSGGEIAPDQMFARRSWSEWPRTPVTGLYLGGASSAVGTTATAAAGWIAAKALIADHRAGRLS